MGGVKLWAGVSCFGGALAKNLNFEQPHSCAALKASLRARASTSCLPALPCHHIRASCYTMAGSQHLLDHVCNSIPLLHLPGNLSPFAKSTLTQATYVYWRGGGAVPWRVCAVCADHLPDQPSVCGLLGWVSGVLSIVAGARPSALSPSVCVLGFVF